MAEPTRCMTPMARPVSPGPFAIVTYLRFIAPAPWLPLRVPLLPGSTLHLALDMARQRLASSA
ncbi:hypothetical protein F3I16_19945 [Pseudomonas sp. L-22-4S-12]|uniref:hypothetical protein n=1 Tax=Pseudomonas sp. L-22-4S-12 TaxID=2610893 RepID=UPI00132A3E3E|nr:hypothetical protein [Pseudomonas sp. L-22-4S-12]MWV18317.1 hypothetical protein [Pseudomonas sp. L-22-4S-12]